MKLYEIANEYQGLIDLVDSGELTQDDIADTLEAVNATFDDKVRACMMIRQDMITQSERLMKEVLRIESLADKLKNDSTSMLDYVKSCMIKMDKSKMDLGLFKLTLKNGSPKLGNIDESKIAKKYWIDVPATQKIDKRMLLSDAKLNPIDGVEIVESDRALMVK